MSNEGDINAGSFVVTYYLSEDGTTASSVLKKSKVRRLAAGRSASLSFSYRSRTSLTGKYIIAVVDSGNSITETDENNNEAVARIP